MNVISPTLVQEGWLQQVEAIQQQMSRVQQEASTGLAFSTPAENPVGTAAVIALDAQKNAARNFEASQNTAANVLQVVAGSLGGMTHVLQQAEQLAIAMDSPTASGSTGAALSEAQALLGQLTELLNTQTDGYYVFAAADPLTPVATSVALINVPSSASTAPWTWELPVAPGLDTPISVNGFEPGIQAGGVSGFSVALQALNTLVTEVASGSTATAQGEIHQALSALTTATAVTGTYQDMVQQTGSQMQTWLTALSSQLSGTEDANMAQVASSLSTTETIYQAALRAGSTLLQANLWTVIKP